MKVPVITGPEVRQAPLGTPEIRVAAGPLAFGAGVAAGIQNVGEVAQGVVMEQKRDADSRKVIEIMGLATDLNNETLTQLQSRKMMEARGVTDEARGAFEKTAVGALAWAENETQRDILTRALTQQSTAMLQSARSHEVQELDNYNEFSMDQAIKSSEQSVSIDPLNYDLALVSKGNAAAAVAKRWEGKVGAEQLAQLREAAVSSVTTRQLESLLANNRNADFLVLYPQVKGELRGKDADNMAKIASATSDLNVEQALTDVLFAKHPDDEIGALNEANAMLQGEQQDNVMNRLKVRFGDVESAAKNVEQADIDAIKSAYINGGYRMAGIPSDLVARVQKHNPEVIIAMRDHELQQATRTTTVKTDPASWTRWAYLTDEQKLDPKNDPIHWVNTWNESDYQRAVSTVAALRAGRGPGGKPKESVTEADINKVITGEFDRAYGPNGRDSDADKKRFSNYDGFMRKQIERYQASNKGLLPSFDELQKLSAYALAEGSRVGQGRIWGDRKGRRFESLTKPGGEEFRPNDPSAPQDNPIDDVMTVPDDIALKIADHYNTRGIFPTKQQILNTYRRSLGLPPVK